MTKPDEFRGFPACECLIQWLPWLETEAKRQGLIKHNIDIAQLIGGYVLSGGTHLPGGAADLWQHTRAFVKLVREMGGAGFGRTEEQGFDPHCHLVLKGCPHNDGGRYQIGALEAGYNGLGAGGRGGQDDGPRDMPIPLRTWKEGIAWAKARQPRPFNIRVGTFNWPGPGTGILTNTTGRLEAGARLVAGAHLDVLGIQEAIGWRSPGHPSSYALQVRDAVREATGMKWNLTMPKGPNSALNENYLLTRDATIKVASQWNDSVLRPSGVSGRHLVRTVLRHRATGRKFGMGVTHLVDNNCPGAQKQAAIVAQRMATIGKIHNCPLIVVGDMNDDDDLKALVDAGYANARKAAKAKTRQDQATFTNYAKTKPSMNTEFRLDQIYVKGADEVAGQTLILGTKGGVFTDPRPSDHGLLYASINFD